MKKLIFAELIFMASIAMILSASPKIALGVVAAIISNNLGVICWQQIDAKKKREDEYLRALNDLK